MPKLSVIIPLYNKEKDIKNTLKSVLAQSFNNFEIIIIDDGSTDNSTKIVNELNDKRITLISKKNEGVSIARNFGVDKANSEYVAFLDADDYWFPNHLENLAALINKYPKHKWFASAYEKKRSATLTTKMNSPIMKKGGNWSGVINDFFENCYIDCLTWTSAVCFKKPFFTNLDGFNSNYTHGEDTDLWIRAALNSNLVFSNKITSTHNLVGNNRSAEIKMSNRKHFNLEQFTTAEKTNASLKKYLDLNRYSLALQFKISEDFENHKLFKGNINLKNLNNKQQFLLKQDRKVLLLFNTFQGLLEKYGLRLSTF